MHTSTFFSTINMKLAIFGAVVAVMPSAVISSAVMPIEMRDWLEDADACWVSAKPRGVGRVVSSCAPGLEQSG